MVNVFRNWLDDTLHYWKTGESTIRCYNEGEMHKVFIDPWGGSRVDPSDAFRSKRGREDLKAMAKIARSYGAKVLGSPPKTSPNDNPKMKFDLNPPDYDIDILYRSKNIDGDWYGRWVWKYGRHESDWEGFETLEECVRDLAGKFGKGG